VPLFREPARHAACDTRHLMEHPKSDERVMDDIGDVFDGDASTSETDAHTGQTPPDELARVHAEADEKIGEGGKTGMSGAESGYGTTGESSGLESTE
jgi:hypothetical protein